MRTYLFQPSSFRGNEQVYKTRKGIDRPIIVTNSNNWIDILLLISFFIYSFNTLPPVSPIILRVRCVYSTSLKSTESRTSSTEMRNIETDRRYWLLSLAKDGCRRLFARVHKGSHCRICLELLQMYRFLDIISWIWLAFLVSTATAEMSGLYS